MRDKTGRAGIIASRGLDPNGEPTPISYKLNSCLRTWYKGYNPKSLQNRVSATAGDKCLLNMALPPQQSQRVAKRVNCIALQRELRLIDKVFP